ncbi:leucine-rich_repeat protein [Hexamita inflata]|uniref:Leucine-rich_repeat protein n=1 Tax=Hexamita inflata TaxID=28002 RepID=A0ABP1HM53_9EUKA
MIAKYQNRVHTHLIAVENVSENHIDQIYQNTNNRDCEQKGDNYLLHCTQENIQTILNRIEAIDPNLKTTQEPFRFLMISEDNELEELGFVNELNLQNLAVQDSKNVKYTEIVDVKIFSVLASELENLEGIQNWTELRELYLNINNLKNFEQQQNLTNLTVQIQNLEPLERLSLSKLLNLQTLIINDNKLTYLSCLKPLAKLVHLDVRRNILLEVDFVLELKELKILLLEGNMIYHREIVQKHPNYNNWIKSKILPPKTILLSDLEKKTSRQSFLYYQSIKDIYNRKMIAKYQNRVNTHVIAVENVSENQIYQIYQNTNNRDCEQKGDKYLLHCTQENIQTILNRIEAIDPNLKTTQEPFRFLMISEDNELEELGFVNELNLQKLAVQDSKNVKYTEIVDVKIFSVLASELENLEGIQNWTELRELYLNINNLKNFEQQQNLTNLTVQIQNLEPLERLSLSKLLNLQTLIINDNKLTEPRILMILCFVATIKTIIYYTVNLLFHIIQIYVHYNSTTKLFIFYIFFRFDNQNLCRLSMLFKLIARLGYVLKQFFYSITHFCRNNKILQIIVLCILFSPWALFANIRFISNQAPSGI